MPTDPLQSTYTDIHTILMVQPDAPSHAANEQWEQAAGEAEAEINGYLARLYTLPFSAQIPLLTSLATDIAIFKVFASKTFTAPPRDVETAWSERYKAAVAILLRLASGEMALVDLTGAVVPTRTDADSLAGTAWSSTMRYTPTFGESDDRGFFVDRNKVEDEISRRS
jgi:phage gp36-like protein